MEVDGAKPVDSHVIEIVAACTPLAAAHANFLASHACVWNHARTVHVVQGELATVPVTIGSVAVLGSTDATTCLLAAAFDARSGLASVAHYDDGSILDPRNTANLVQGMERPSLYLAGAARCGGERGAATAAATLHALLRVLDRSPMSIDLRLFCALDWNTDEAGRPRAQALALALPSGTPFLPESWRDRGPLVEARMAQLWCGAGPGIPMKSIIDGKESEWLVTVVAGEAVASPGRRQRLQALVDLPDEELLQECSTSPECELPHVAEDIRAALRWVVAQDGPLRLEQHRFRWIRGQGWVILQDNG